MDGLTTYGAFQFVVIAWGVIGYAAMFWLLRHVLRCSLVICLIWSALFAFSNLNALQVGHMQLLVAAFVPLLLGCVLLLWRGLMSAARLKIAAGGTIAVL